MSRIFKKGTILYVPEDMLPEVHRGHGDVVAIGQGAYTKFGQIEGIIVDTPLVKDYRIGTSLWRVRPAVNG